MILLKDKKSECNKIICLNSMMIVYRNNDYTILELIGFQWKYQIEM